jgi:hypothetical protein
VTVRAYAAGVATTATIPNAVGVHRICEGPISPSLPSRRVTLLATVPVKSDLRVAVFAHARRDRHPIAEGSVAAIPTLATIYAIGLSRTVPTRPVDVCVSTSTGGTFSLGGELRSGRGGVHILDHAGSTPGYSGLAAFAVILTSANRRSFLGSLALAFERASLFHPSWVGAWTFWVLLVLLVLGFPAALLAAVLAGRQDSRADPCSRSPDGSEQGVGI